MRGVGDIHTYMVLVGSSEGKRLLGRHRCRWGVNIKMGLQEVGWGSIDCIALAHVRDRWGALANEVMSFRVS